MSSPDLLLQDATNRQRALELQSFIVEAPAGAGKTELLTQRYLKLLAVVNEPEEIVAITFTNKAAAEMRSRVLQSLQDAADAIPIDKPHKQTTRELALQALARSAEQGWDLLSQPARLRINTIDSLSSHLARQMPLMSRFGAQPGVSDDAATHYREAARRTLAMLEDDNAAVTEALRYFDNDAVKLTNLLAEMLAKRDQWLHHAGREAVQDEVESALHHLVRHDIMRAAEALTPSLQKLLMPVARYAASNLACDQPIALLLDWDAPIPAEPQALPLWRSVCELLMTQKNEFRKSVNVNQGFPPNDESKAHKQALTDIIAALPNPLPLARLRDLPNAQHSDEEWRIVGSLAQLLKLAAAHLWTVFQEAGEVDFVEVSTRALTALEDETGPTDLALRLDYRIQHLLVDEFQDTSPTQVALLEKLTRGWEVHDGRTLFCVGDPMQSIYRFRKADVGLFLQVAEFGIGHLHLTPLKLTRNNRSAPAVVDWVNHAFASVFPAADSETRGAIRYREFAATRDPMPGEGVLVHPLVLDKANLSDETAALEACYLADLIEREQQAAPEATIAVLVRARAHLEALVAEIRRHRPNLRFQAVEIEQLAGRQTVQDALALTRALFHRADRVNWLAMLRAPWCGLTLADLHVLAADDHYATLWQLMQDAEHLARLSPDGQQRLLHVRGILQEAFAHQGRQPLRRWVEAVWLKLGGPHCLWEAGDVRDVQAFFDLVEKLDAGGSFDPDRLEDAMSELYAAPDVQADGKLQFMTIHKSKGLEFDTVILPGLHRVPRAADAPLVLWENVPIEDAAPQLIAAPWVPKHKRDDLPSTYDYLQGLEAERAANEAARVLYVAATRTVRRLHLVGALKPNTKDELKPPSATFLGLLWHTAEADFLRAAANPQAAMAEAANEADFIPQLIRLPQPAIPDLLLTPTTSLGSGMDELAPAEEDSGGNRLDANIGTLAHRYVEIIANTGLTGWTPERVAQLKPAMTKWLAQQGHTPDEAESGAARVVSALQNTLRSEAGQWILQTRDQAASEYSLSTASGNHITTHIVDRTFVEKGERWIVDYKSARLDKGIQQEALEQQAERYRPQLERYAKLFSGEGLPLRKAVFFLAHGRLVELSSS